MASVNKVILVGNLGKDPETRYTPDGLAIVTFSLATTDTWKDKATGEKKDRTEWHRISAFGKLGEICGEWLTKGKQVYIEGRIQTRSWEKDGVTRYVTDIIATDMKMLGSAGGSKSSGGIPPISSNEASDMASGFPGESFSSKDAKDDLPF